MEETTQAKQMYDKMVKEASPDSPIRSEERRVGKECKTDVRQNGKRGFSR